MAVSDGRGPFAWFVSYALLGPRRVRRRLRVGEVEAARLWAFYGVSLWVVSYRV